MINNWLKNKKITTAVVIFGLLIFLHWTGLLSPIESLFSRLMTPMAVRFYNFGVDINSRYLQSADSHDLSALLQEQIDSGAEILRDNARLHEVERENKILRDFLKFFTENKFDYIMANVVAKEVVSQSADERNKIIIDKGFNDGLRESLVVVDHLGFVVGRITKIKEHLSEVSLLVDQNCRLAVSVQNDEGVAGIAAGESGLTVKVGFIPQIKKIAVDQLVVTAGLENNVPGGLVLGKISQVDKASNELWQEALVDLSADLDALRIVSVLIPPPHYW